MTERPNWVIIGDWLVYRYSQFLAVFAWLLLIYWVLQ